MYYERIVTASCATDHNGNANAMLTRKQHETLAFITDRIDGTGMPPSFDEIREHLGLASKSGVHRLVEALEERGFIRRLPNRARAIEILKRIPAPSKEPSLAKPTPVPANDRGSIPLMGRIAAGVPIAAVQIDNGMVQVPPDMLGAGEHFALRVTGDSMIEAGILDGDTVVIARTSTARPGEIVVALIDNEEATLKRYRRKGDFVALEAANPAYETRFLHEGRVNVQGKLIGVMRSYH